jgi:broad specificity phosphatase PhoE
MSSGVLADSLAVWLIRHGETQWSLSGQHTGRTDIPLTEAGQAQARALSPMLADIAPAMVLSSPRQRARETARLAGLHVDAIDDDLSEWDYGDYEGLTSPQIQQRAPGWTLFADGVPNGESAEQVGQRADRVIARARALASNGPVVLVAHGHISRVIGVRWIGLEVAYAAHFALGTAAPSRLGAQHGQPVITHWNMLNPLADG